MKQKKQKKQPFRVLSNKVCIEPGCNRRLKANLVARKPTACRCNRCYWRYRISVENTMPTQWNLTAAHWSTRQRLPRR